VLLVGPRISHLGPFFEKRGYRPVPSPTGNAALGHVRNQAWNLIVIELDLDGMEAVTFMKKVKELQTDVRFLLLDDSSRAGKIVKTIQAGAHSFLSTPPNETDLFERVEWLLRMKSAADQVGSAQKAMADFAAYKAKAEREEQKAMEAVMQIELLSQEMATLRTQLDQAKSATADVDDKVDEERAKRKKAEEMAADLKADLVEAQAEIDALKEAPDQVGRLEEKLQKQVRTRKKLETRVRELTQRLEQESQSRIEQATDLGQLEDLQDENRQLRRVVKKLRHMESERDRLADELAKLRSSVGQAMDSDVHALATMEGGAVLDSQDAVHQEVEMLRRAMAEMEHELSVAQERAADAQQEIEDQQVRQGYLEEQLKAYQEFNEGDSATVTNVRAADVGQGPSFEGGEGEYDGDDEGDYEDESDNTVTNVRAPESPSAQHTDTDTRERNPFASTDGEELS
jgi:DNA-binding response OmpR family regulator